MADARPMALEGLAQVRARIAEIEGTTGARSTTASSSASADSGFASMLASAIGDPSSPSPSAASSSSSSLGASDLSLGSLLANPALALSASGLTTGGTGTTDPSVLSALTRLLGTGGTGATIPTTATVATTATAAGVTGTVAPAGAPAELAAYGNGRIPDGVLVAIDDRGNRLWAPAARAFDAMRTAAAAAGVDLGVTSSYRSRDQQAQMVQEQGLYGQGGLAATPGHSEHGWGRALDLEVDADAQSWLRQHAADYGFTAPVAGEPWHWEYGTGR